MKVLTIHFSQSGQLTEILTNFTHPFNGVEMEHQFIVPKNKFPFPWDVKTFFETMPESVLEIPIELEAINYNYSKYDLVIIGYQPWFLSPSLPITSILKDEQFKAIIKDTPIITVIGSRNMWLNSQESVKKLIQQAGGKLVGNVALADKSDNLIGVITILHWMLKGEKTRKWGILPKPGVADEDIENVKLFGEFAAQALQKNDWNNFQNQVIQNDGVVVRTNILFIEQKAKRLFIIWANLILKQAKKGKRSFWVNAFKYYLIFVLFVVSPILLALYRVLIWPFTFKKVNARKKYFQQIAIK